MKPVIKWSGSKRSQAIKIMSLAPSFERYYEPFIGGGSMLYAFAPSSGFAGDICEPLIDLWNMIKNEPVALSLSYKTNWTRLQTEGHQVFYEIRDHFNSFKDPESLLFLSRTCVNGLIRFNKNGEFNNSFHHTRPGIKPDTLTAIINDWSCRISSTSFICADYRETTSTAKRGDFIYLDPPYFNTKGRYYGGIDYDEFFEYLDRLNQLGISFALSFDGQRGEKIYSSPIPKELYKRKILLPSGNSAFRKLQDKEKEAVFESLYLNY